MKSVVTQPSKKPSAPCLMESIASGTVYFIHRWGSGTVVYSKAADRPVGYASSCLDMNLMRPFGGTITLEND